MKQSSSGDLVLGEECLGRGEKSIDAGLLCADIVCGSGTDAGGTMVQSQDERWKVEKPRLTYGANKARDYH